MPNTKNAIGYPNADGSFDEIANNNPKYDGINAADVSFDNTGTGMSATNVQGAIGEVNSKIAVIDTRTPSAISSSTLVDLPTGFTRNNCMVIGAEIWAGRHYDIATMLAKSTGANIQISISGNNDQISIDTDANVNAAWLNKPVKIAVLKF